MGEQTEKTNMSYTNYFDIETLKALTKLDIKIKSYIVMGDGKRLELIITGGNEVILSQKMINMNERSLRTLKKLKPIIVDRKDKLRSYMYPDVKIDFEHIEELAKLKDVKSLSKVEFEKMSKARSDGLHPGAQHLAPGFSKEELVYLLKP